MEENRGTGRTTRLIDSYIQDLFKNKIIEVKDHYDHIEAHKYLLKRIVDRFNNEFNRGHQKLKIHNLTIELIDINK